MVAVKLAIGGVPGVGLEGRQVVRPALQQQPFVGGPVSLQPMEGRQVRAGARQVVVQIRLVGEVGRQLLLEASLRECSKLQPAPERFTRPGRDTSDVRLWAGRKNVLRSSPRTSSTASGAS